jgi:hypothetical protein
MGWAIAHYVLNSHCKRSLLRNKLKRSPYSAEKKQGDRIFLGYGGDRLCKCSTTGRVIASRKKLRSPSSVKKNRAITGFLMMTLSILNISQVMKYSLNTNSVVDLLMQRSPSLSLWRRNRGD